METALELGRHAARIKLAEEGGMNLGARPAATPAPPPSPSSANVSMTMRAPTPRPAAPAGGGFLAGIGNFFRNPVNMAQMIGASGNLGKGLLGMTGAPGLFALSNLARGGNEMRTLLQGPTQGTQPGTTTR